MIITFDVVGVIKTMQPAVNRKLEHLNRLKH